MTLKPDILEKGETLIDNINAKVLPEVQPTVKNLKEVSAMVNASLLPETQKTLETVNRTVAKINKALPIIIGSLCVMSLSALATIIGVVVLLVR